MEPMMDRLLTAKEAAAYLGLTVKTLANFRSTSTGPPYIILRGTGRSRGAVRYERPALHDWAAEGRVTPGRGLT